LASAPGSVDIGSQHDRQDEAQHGHAATLTEAIATAPALTGIRRDHPAWQPRQA
jgi:hypothetical protein